MIEPTGYTALDLIGFTDRGAYDPTANYVKNDIVTVGNTKWRCKVDDTTGVTPAENANWTIYLESATSLAGMDDVTLTSPKNGDGLVHDGNDWKNIPIMTKEQWQKNGAYNILEITATTQVVSGVTYTVNSNKTITAVSDGTNSNSYLPLTTTWKAPVTGKYKFVGCPSGGASNKYMMYIAEAGQSAMAYDYGDGVEVNLTAGTTYYVYIVVANSQTVNITFKPMITTDLNATYADYVPYAMTNRELTERVTETLTYDGVDYVFTRQGNFMDFYVGYGAGAKTFSTTSWIIIGTLTKFRPSRMVRGSITLPASQNASLAFNISTTGVVSIIVSTKDVGVWLQGETMALYI